jgi:hypothetical protein
VPKSNLSTLEGYHERVRVVLLIYAVGVAIGLVFADAKPIARIALALAWPIGPAAFVATIALLLAASLVIFPLFGAVVALGAAATWWVLST